MPGFRDAHCRYLGGCICEQAEHYCYLQGMTLGMWSSARTVRFRGKGLCMDRLAGGGEIFTDGYAISGCEDLTRPGVSGDRIPWKDLSYGTSQ